MDQLAIPTIPDSEKTPAVTLLLEYLHRFDLSVDSFQAIGGSYPLVMGLGKTVNHQTLLYIGL